ncbi:unnamed protein product [Urochloa humidicola]
MRAGGCTVQQALSPEAAVVVKQAVTLARRRGNAQVTPLHVASAMLHQPAPAPAAAGSPPPSSSTTTAGLLRAACLRSHSHPLQCKALELCFNVALNRLPSSASPLLAGGGHVYYPPSLSNALVAAFKRAQAHQRRGSSSSAAADTQPPPPVLAVKIELEQLVISILDDPSVSRVMREAGFSSTHVKANVEHVIEANSSASSSMAAATGAPQNPNPSAVPSEETKPSKLLMLPLGEQVRDEDVAAILDCLASRRKRRVMVVAECAAAAEAAARAALEKVRRGDAAALRGARVVSLAVSAFRDLPRGEAERRLAELRCAVKGGGGMVVVVEDLGWAAEFWASGRRGEVAAGRGMMMRWPAAGCCGSGYYCAVEHVVAEVRAMACRGDGGVWLVGYGTYQSYMRCRAGQPSLESLWGLQTLAVPAGSLALSLNCVDDSAMAVSHLSSRAKCEATSGNGSVSRRCMSLLEPGGSAGQLMTACCGDCSDTKCDAAKELARSVLPASTIIPPWLQHCRSNQEPSHCKNWSSPCGDSPSHHHHRTTALNFSTVVSPSSSSVSSYEKHYHHLHHQPYQRPWHVATDVHEAAKDPWNARSGGCGAQVHVVDDDEDVKLVVSEIKQAKSHDSSASNNGSVEQAAAERRRSRFKELTAENLKVLCSALEKEVPWQADLAPEIASTVLRCRSGMARRRAAGGVPGSSGSTEAAAGAKEDTCLLFLGGDAEGKARVARELARLVFGSRNSFVSVGAAVVASSSSSPARSSDSAEQHRKRPRLLAASDNVSGVERLYEAVRDNPHRVILVENVVEQFCQRSIVKAIESGVVRSNGGDEAAVGDAIIVLSCESFDAKSRTSSPLATKKAKNESEEVSKEEEEDRVSPSSSCFDLNMSVENDDVEESCIADTDLLKAVDRVFFFRRPDESSD